MPSCSQHAGQQNGYPVPSMSGKLHRFLGMTGYYRSFCKNFSVVVALLTTLCSPKVSFVWTVKCQYAFEAAKSFLSSAPVLATPNFSFPFKLEVDWLFSLPPHVLPCVPGAPPHLWVHMHFNYVEPVSIYFGQNESGKECFGQYIPVKKTTESLLSLSSASEREQLQQAKINV